MAPSAIARLDLRARARSALLPGCYPAVREFAAFIVSSLRERCSASRCERPAASLSTSSSSSSQQHWSVHEYVVYTVHSVHRPAIVAPLGSPRIVNTDW
jgi:hypothetical protein